MYDSRSILKGVFILVAALWTVVIIVNVARDLYRPESNYFGVFFAILIALALIVLGNGVLAGLYFLLKRVLK